MSFQLLPKLVTLNDLHGVMAVTLRYFIEFGSAFQHITASARKKKEFTFPISSADELLVHH